MAKKVINAFNGGEVSPNTHARFDSALYDKACIKLENFVPLQAGGVERRPATKHLASLSSTTNVIYPFVFNNENAYSLIFTNTSLIIYKDDTVKFSLSTPYLTAELYDLKITQSADVVFIAHPNHAVRQLSRLSDTSWTFNILNFKVPPLLDEDINKTFSITGSSSKGSTVTITSNTDLFTTEHIGGKFLIKQLRDDSNSILIGSNASGTTTASDYFVSNSINIGMSNWSIETKGTWRGVVTILRSEDGGDTYEEYVRLADTSAEPLEGHDPDTDTNSNKNFTFASTQPEPLGALLKVQYTQPDSTDVTYDDYKDFSFELKADDPYLYALCLITGRTSGLVATATLESPLAYTTTDFGTNWAASTTFNKGDKVVFGGTLTVTNVSATNEFIQLNDENGDALSDNYTVQGMAYGDAKLWVLATASSDGSGTQKVYSYTIANQGQSTLAYSYSANVTLSGTTYTRVSDIAYYNSELYVLGVNSAGGNTFGDAGQASILLYNTSGVYQSTFYNFPINSSTNVHTNPFRTLFTFGLGFDGQYFYATEHFLQWTRSGKFNIIDRKIQTRKIDTSASLNTTVIHNTTTTGSKQTAAFSTNMAVSNYNFVTSNDVSNNPDNHKFFDWTSVEGKLYALNDVNDRWDTFDTGLGDLSLSLSIGQTVASAMRGTAFDSTNDFLYGIQSNGMIIEFGFVGGSVYYQATSKHASGSTSFATWLAQGYWIQRFPESVNFQEGAYSDHRGYPHSIAIYESRLCFGGTDSNPNTLWLSKSNDLNNFQTGTEANASMRLTINSNTIDEIRWLCPTRKLIIGTSANEWALGSGSDQLAITPTQFDIKRQSNYGSNKQQGLLVNASILFLMRQGKKLREWIDQNTPSLFLASDLTAVADHILEGGGLQFAVQTEPETIIWIVRNDGTLVGLTYEKETDTFAWHRHIFKNASGVLEKIESVSVVPTLAGEDCVYLILNKADNERCYIKMDSRNWGSTYTTEYNGLDNYTSSSKAVSSQSASFSAGELDQFASDIVKVKVNGVLQTGTYTVGSDGSLTINSIKDASGANLDNGTYTIVVGQAYTSTLAPLYIDSSTSYGSKKSVQKATLRFKDTLSAKTGQTETDTDPVKFTSDSTLNSEDAEVWLSNANEFLQTVYVIQDEPQPCTVLAMIATVEGT